MAITGWVPHQAGAAGVSRPFVAKLRAGGNVTPEQDETLQDDNEDISSVQRGPDPAQRALRQLVSAYAGGHGRTKFGFGKAVSPKTVRRYLERLDDDAYEGAVTALRAWAEVLADEATWLPDEEVG